MSSSIRSKISRKILTKIYLTESFIKHMEQEFERQKEYLFRLKSSYKNWDIEQFKEIDIISDEELTQLRNMSIAPDTDKTSDTLSMRAVEAESKVIEEYSVISQYDNRIEPDKS